MIYERYQTNVLKLKLNTNVLWGGGHIKYFTIEKVKFRRIKLHDNLYIEI